MRGIADFDPEWASSYFLPRETIQPPPLLLSRIWPDMDRWQAAHLERPDASEWVEPNLAAGRVPTAPTEAPLCILAGMHKHGVIFIE